MKTFPELFRKYRLKAEFETFTEFGNALSEKGYHYEESIFSRWQSGKRRPSTRALVLTILGIFVERDAINTIHEANEFLSSTGLGHLTEEEKIDLHLNNLIHVPFQVPNEIENFTGRDETITSLKKETMHGKTILIFGQAGVGKTSLTIKLAHILRTQFTDGVLWYRMEISKLQDILISIAHSLGEDLPKSNDTEVIAAFIRSVLSKKKFCYFLIMLRKLAICIYSFHMVLQVL